MSRESEQEIVARLSTDLQEVWRIVAEDLRAEPDERRIDLEALPHKEMLAVSLHIYSAIVESSDPPPPPVDEGSITATEVVRTVPGLLEAVGLELFELSPWAPILSYRESDHLGGKEA